MLIKQELLLKLKKIYDGKKKILKNKDRNLFTKNELFFNLFIF